MKTGALTWQGAVDANGKALSGLPSPSTDNEPARKVDALLKALFTGANQVIVGTASGTPTVVELAEGEVLGRSAGGAVGGIDAAALATIISSLSQTGVYLFDAASLDPDPTNPPTFERATGTNRRLPCYQWELSTERPLHGRLLLPSNLLSSGTVSFTAIGAAVTAETGKNIRLALGHAPLSSGESWDAAYTEVASGNVVAQATDKYLDYVTWTASVSSLGWAASDLVLFDVYRKLATSGSNLIGNWRFFYLLVSVPREI
ncbi:MAG: hypothetical protein AB7E55_36550 [Pigmentiphaga sp.]